MKIDNEFSDLSMDYTTWEFEFQRANSYAYVKGRLRKNILGTFSAISAILEITDKG